MTILIASSIVDPASINIRDNLLNQSNLIDNRSLLFDTQWSSVYFGRDHSEDHSDNNCEFNIYDNIISDNKGTGITIKEFLNPDPQNNEYKPIIQNNIM